MNNIENKNVTIPQSLLMKLFDFTGSSSGANKGFFLYYINENGEPTMVSKTENACVEMALARLIEMSTQGIIEE